MRTDVRGTFAKTPRGNTRIPVFSLPLIFSLSRWYAFDVGTHPSRSSEDSCFMSSYGGDVRVSFASRRKEKPFDVSRERAIQAQADF